MLFFYALKEAHQTLATHGRRTACMAFGMGWVLFVWIALIGIGNGFQDGVRNAFAKYGEKTLIMWTDWNEAGEYRPIPTELTQDLDQKIQGVHRYTPMHWHLGTTVRYAAQTERTSILAVDACFASLAHTSIQTGRFFTERDADSASNVCVLGVRLKEKLFGRATALGKRVFTKGIGLQVIGILDVLPSNLHGEEDFLLVTHNWSRRYLPAQSRYVDQVRLTLLPEADDQRVEKQLRSYFARHLNLDPTNERFLRIWNITTHANNFRKLFRNTAIFTWIVGICFSIAGAMGTVNALLATIQTRTQEFAVRKVLGARTREIAWLILAEVFLLSLCAGSVGCIAGFSCLHLLNSWIVPLGERYFLAALSCPVACAFQGIGTIFLANGLATILPVYRALKIKPVEALADR